MKDVFSCARCGYCCHGETTVSLDEADVENMQKALGIPVEEMFEKYLRVTGTVVQMKIVDGHCIFYSADKGCDVHLGRPWRCRQWPLHPALLISEDNYTTIAESCPGFTKTMGYDEVHKRVANHLKDSVKQEC